MVYKIIMLEPLDPATPLCFGLYYGTDRQCRACAVKADCKRICARWSKRKSLSELLSAMEAEMDLSNLSDPVEDCVEIYRRVYQKHFGRLPSTRMLSRPNWCKFFPKVIGFCVDHDIEIALWITAQMHGMKAWLAKNRRVGFMPNMLVGEGAKRRYSVYVRQVGRRYKQAKEDTLDNRTEVGRLVDMFTEGEEVVGDYYVAACASDKPIDWKTAVRRTEQPEEWLAWNGGIKDRKRRHHFASWVKRYGRPFMGRLVRLARTRAMVNVARHYHHALPDRIGFEDEPAWEDMAELIARLYPSEPLRVIDLEEVSGTAWGHNG